MRESAREKEANTPQSGKLNQPGENAQARSKAVIAIARHIAAYSGI